MLAELPGPCPQTGCIWENYTEGAWRCLQCGRLIYHDDPTFDRPSDIFAYDYDDGSPMFDPHSEEEPILEEVAELGQIVANKPFGFLNRGDTIKGEVYVSAQTDIVEFIRTRASDVLLEKAEEQFGMQRIRSATGVRFVPGQQPDVLHNGLKAQMKVMLDDGDEVTISGTFRFES
jgi:hypothetical protein